MQVQPTPPLVTRFIVQVAAIDQEEYASDLTRQLRRIGYKVTAERDPVDHLIHCYIGPFNNRSDASAMRQRLINDGYHSEVIP